MGTGSCGAFVISWSQTEVDGVPGAPLDAVLAGAVWRWAGQAVRIDRADTVLHLEAPEGSAELRRRAARMVRWLVGTSLGQAAERRRAMLAADLDDLPVQGFTVTDGRRSHVVSVIEVPDTGARLLLFTGSPPPADRDLWVIETSLDRQAAPAAPGQPRGMICFTPQTRIATPGGSMAVADLRPGDRLLTRDNGPQELLWVGQRHMTGARLYAMPHLRPIRFRGGAFGIGRPDGDLLVSPRHRMLLRGAAAQALFGTDEVLVAAEDLLNGDSVQVDLRAREVTYVHLLLDRHEILFANGVESESFHPGFADPGMIDPAQALTLRALLPDLTEDPLCYGDPARRLLTASEAAILRHDLAA